MITTLKAATVSKLMVILILMLVAAPVALAGDPSDQRMSAGKSAAHAALVEGADVPLGVPKMPELANGRIRDSAHERGADAGGARKKDDATRRAGSQAEAHAADAARPARLEAADRAAQGSVAAASHSANADAHSAAGQARAREARANAAARAAAKGHPVTPAPRP